MTARTFVLALGLMTVGGTALAELKDAIVAYLEDSLRCARRAMTSLTASNHLDVLHTCFGAQPGIEVASGVACHSYNHYGQMVVYARMRGVVPPASRRETAR